MSDYWDNANGPAPNLYRLLLTMDMPPTTRLNVKGGGAEKSKGRHLGLYQVGTAKPICTVPIEYEQVLAAIVALIQEHYPGRKFTTVQLNDGLTAKAHTDRNCFGMSLIMTLWPVTGGEFWHNGTNQTGSGVWGTTETWLEFNGKTAHSSMPCYGRKFAVIAYTNSSITHPERAMPYACHPCMAFRCLTRLLSRSALKYRILCLLLVQPTYLPLLVTLCRSSTMR